MITTNKHGYDVSPGVEPSIGITAVRSPVYSWHDPKLLEPDVAYSYADAVRDGVSSLAPRT